jgi:LPS export ABC transporter protein LptC
MIISRIMAKLKKTGGFRLFFLALLPALLSACENDLEKVNLVAGKKALPVETSSGLTILYSDSGKVKVKISAAEMHRFAADSPYTEMPSGVKVEFFNQDLKVSSTLTSNYAVRKDREFVTEARGDVIVVNEKGEKLNTELLIWDERTSKIFSSEFVKISTPDKIIFGNGFEANQDFTNYKIFNIKGTITIDKDEHPQNP